MNFNPLECSDPESDRCYECLIKNLSTIKCSGSKRKLCDNYDCKKCFYKSFASQIECRYWDHKNNGGITPFNMFKSCDMEFAFNCTCGHQFQGRLDHITLRNVWCPYCSNPPKKLCERDDCLMCFNNSFSSHPKSEFWDLETNKITPRQVCKHSNTLYTFNCKCGHAFNASLSNVSKTKNGRWCPYCTPSANKLCPDANCHICYERSFASNPRSKNWDINKNTCAPRDIAKRTHVQYHFICDKGHEFYMDPNHIGRNGWCQHCTYKTEQMVFDLLTDEKMLPIAQPKFNWCVKIKEMPFDIQVNKWLIEVDGDQHFRDISLWKTKFETIAINDAFKMKKALENGYSVVRLVQEEIYRNKWDWKTTLLDIVKSTRDIPDIIYLCHKKEIYDYHKKEMV